MSSEHISENLRQQVKDRANGLCEYCKSPDKYSIASFHCDHINPKKAGGKTELTNLAFACPSCNTHKYTKTVATDPQTREKVPLFNPRKQNWQQHFQWSNDLILIQGRTPTGRATVQALNMNKDKHIELRKLLKDAGKHPAIENRF